MNRTLFVCFFYLRLMEAFVSVQLEKVSLRDEMLNSFVKKNQAVGGLVKTPVRRTQRWQDAERHRLQMKCKNEFLSHHRRKRRRSNRRS